MYWVINGDKRFHLPRISTSMDTPSCMDRSKHCAVLEPCFSRTIAMFKIKMIPNPSGQIKSNFTNLDFPKGISLSQLPLGENHASCTTKKHGNMPNVCPTPINQRDERHWFPSGRRATLVVCLFGDDKTVFHFGTFQEQNVLQSFMEYNISTLYYISTNKDM